MTENANAKNPSVSADANPVTLADFVRSIVAVGGREWKTDSGKHRVYFNDLEAWYGLDLEFYKSGNIHGAMLDGRGISNTSARKIRGLIPEKLYFDLTDEKWHWYGGDRSHALKIIDRIKKAATTGQVPELVIEARPGKYGEGA
jgi:hypothetical protein